MLWFKNLLVPDKYGIPILVLLGNLAITELFCLKRGTQTTLFTYILRVVFLLLAYVTSIMPSVSFVFIIIKYFIKITYHFLIFFLEYNSVLVSQYMDCVRAASSTFITSF